MGRTEKSLTRLRDSLRDEAAAPNGDAVANELRSMADAVPAADAAVEPLLRELAAAAAGGDAVGSGVRAALDAALEYCARRDHPQRDSLLEAAESLVATLAPSAAGPSEGDDTPALGTATALPPSFVGELPPESTLDDAALLLVQLEPEDRYGIRSLVEILERLATDPGQSAGARGRLQEAARLLTHGASAASLEEVGSILESLQEAEDGVEPEPASPSEPAGVPSSSSTTPAAAPTSAPEVELAGPWRPGPDTDADLLREFLVESRDLVASAEQALLALEADPTDTEAINVVFRAFHTIKGTAAFLGVEQAAELCHHAESLLSRVRDGAISFGPTVADVSLRSGDLLNEILHNVGVALEGGEPTSVKGMGPVIDRLQAVASGEVEVEEAEVVVAAGPRAVRESSGTALRETSVRVQTDRLDRLVDMVGELVIAHSMIAQDGVVRDDAQHGLAKKVAHAGKIVRELQDLSMALRMVPLKSTFSKLQRLVRDLARKSGKKVQLMMEGEETEIDRTMVDILGDPLVHMIRNAVDHGIERGDARRGDGKPEMGTLWLRSYHAGGNVVVELEDDGRGMDRDKIVAKALERGLIRSAEGLTDGEVWKLVFEPGFSTADTVTDVSGRGVGMDVVRRNIESLRGRIEVDSTPGSGTKITLRLPLTLAITEGMLMRVGSERYILPTLSIERNIRPTADMLSTVASQGEMLMLREELLPIVRLHRLFGVHDGQTSLEEGLLVVVGAAERRCALLVDELLGQQQVVVKSLGDGLGKVEGVTGGAVLGDGTVGLILDPIELVNLARQGTASPRAA